MDILKILPKDISGSLFKYMRQPYLDTVDLHNIVLQKRCVGCDTLIRRHIPGSNVKGVVFQCQSCHRLVCRNCIFFGMPQQPISRTCQHNGLKMI